MQASVNPTLLEHSVTCTSLQGNWLELKMIVPNMIKSQKFDLVFGVLILRS